MEGIERLVWLLSRGIGRRAALGAPFIAVATQQIARAQDREGPHFPCRIDENGDLELPIVASRCNRRQKRRWSAYRWAVECKRIGQADCDGACVRPKDQHRCAPPPGRR